MLLAVERPTLEKSCQVYFFADTLTLTRKHGWHRELDQVERHQRRYKKRSTLVRLSDAASWDVKQVYEVQQRMIRSPQKSPRSDFDRVAKMEPTMGGSGRGRAICSIFFQLAGGVLLVSA